jgi:hypothetical protein
MLRYELQYIPDILKKNYGLDFNVPIRLDISVGDTWGTVKEVK